MDMRLYRLKQRLTQKQIADAVSINVSTYCRYEENPAKMPLGIAIAIANILGTNAENFLDSEEN